MKKVVNLLSIIFILLLFYLTRNSNILNLIISFSLYILFYSIFSTISFNKNSFKLYKFSLLFILIIGIALTFISYLLVNLLNIHFLNIINVCMVGAFLSNILLKITKDYLNVINYKKLSNNILIIYNFITIIIKILLLIFLFGIFKINSNIGIMLLYLVDVIVFIVFGIMLYILVFRKIKNSSKDSINYIKEIKNILINNRVNVIYRIINSSYIYTSIIVLYFVLKNRYNYSYDDVSRIITNTYFYGLIVMYILYIFIRRYLNIDVKNCFNNNLNRVFRIMSIITLLLTFISKPISYIMFGSDYNILVSLVPLFFSFVFYDFIINTSINYNKEKNIIISLIIGFFVKILFEIPLINAVYRMGFSLVFGSILSTILGFVISSIICIIIIKIKLKISLLDNFNSILNILYDSIIYTLILVLFTFIINIDTNTIISSILVILFYIFVTVLFIYIRKKLVRK